jgi:DNA-binding NarL/FixJ family response regulator
MKVLLVDDHPLILQALQMVISGLGDDVTVVGVQDGASARRALEEDSSFDLILLDLALGEEDGMILLGQLRAAYPAVPVVVVSASERTVDVIRALDAGAMGFVPKRASNAALFDALRQVLSGAVYLPDHVLGVDRPPLPHGDTVPAVMRTVGSVAEHAEPASHQKAGTSLASIGLTPRQTDVLMLLLQGKPNKLIARELNVSVETVKDHVAAVLRALNVNSRTQAVLAVSAMTQGREPATWRPGQT